MNKLIDIEKIKIFYIELIYLNNILKIIKNKNNFITIR